MTNFLHEHGSELICIQCIHLQQTFTTGLTSDVTTSVIPTYISYNQSVVLGVTTTSMQPTKISPAISVFMHYINIIVMVAMHDDKNNAIHDNLMNII